MAAITLSQAQIQLNSWLAADTATAAGQSYSIAAGNGSRTVTRANASEIRNNIVFWEAKVDALSRGGIRIIGGTPCG